MFLPSSVEPTFLKLSRAFTQPTAARMSILMVGMILSLGWHTVTAALRMTPPCMPRRRRKWLGGVHDPVARPTAGPVVVTKETMRSPDRASSPAGPPDY